MDCIYLSCVHSTCTCHAQPLRTNEAVVWYQPTEKELADLCHNSDKFNACPRFKAFQNQKTRLMVKAQNSTQLGSRD